MGLLLVQGSQSGEYELGLWGGERPKEGLGRGLKSTFPQELHAAGLPDRHFQSQHNLPGRLPPHSILMIFLFFVSESPSLVSYSLCS